MEARQVKKSMHTFMILAAFIGGLLLLLYPALSNYWYSQKAAQKIATYNKELLKAESEKYDQMWREAAEYNNSVVANGNYYLTEEQQLQYKSALSLDGSNIMGYIKIAKIGCSLPIYHGTTESVLQNGAGHIEWTSLPIGGKGTHCVLSGHRGLPQAKLFTDLDKLKKGDTFVLQILNRVLTYEIRQIQVIKPTELEALQIDEGQDLCTLITCTPYGINSHRLLLKGYRIENISKNSSKVGISPIYIISLVSASILLVVLGVWIFVNLQKKFSGGDKCENKV